jgi:hypothetical protein
LPLFRAIEIEKVSPVINIASVDTRFGWQSLQNPRFLFVATIQST